MTEDRVEGGLKKGMGKVEDAWGGLTGDAASQAKGKVNQAAGSVQDAVGQAKDAVGQARDRVQDVYDDVESYAKEQPLQALGITLVVGMVLGLFLRGGRKTVYVRK